MKSTEEMLQAAVQQLQTAEQARLTSETDPARRQLLHLLYAREAAALQSMTLVRAEIPAAQKRNWKPLIFPLAATVLNLGALALWLTLPSCVTPENSGWMGRFALCIVVQSVSLCAAIGSIVSAMRRKLPEPAAVADETERQERLEQLAYLLLPDKANDSEAGIFFCKNGRKMITAALICYYGMGWGFVEICEFFLGHDWRSLLNDIAKQQNPIANMFISSFAGASEQNTAGCKQAADDALKLFATNEKIKNALRKSASYEQSISPATLETSSIYIYIPDEKLKIYGDLLRIITAQSMEYFSSRPPENKQTILFCLDEFASFGKLQIVESLRKLRKRRIRILVLTQSVSDVDMIYGKDERKAMLGNFKFTVILGCKDTETQEYFSKMIGEKRSLLATDPYQKPQPIIKPADLAHLEQDLFVICDDGAIRLKKNFYFK